jgi:hypothetical protein
LIDLTRGEFFDGRWQLVRVLATGGSAGQFAQQEWMST